MTTAQWLAVIGIACAITLPFIVWRVALFLNRREYEQNRQHIEDITKDIDELLRS